MCEQVFVYRQNTLQKKTTHQNLKKKDFSI